LRVPDEWKKSGVFGLRLGGEDTDGFMAPVDSGCSESGVLIENDEQQLDTGTGLSAKGDLPLFNQSKSAAEQDSSTIQRSL